MHYLVRQGVEKNVICLLEFLVLVNRVSRNFSQVYTSSKNFQAFRTLRKQAIIFESFHVFAECRGITKNFWYWPL